MISETTAQKLSRQLEALHQTERKNWLAALTETSPVLLDTQDIAALTNLSYHYTYTKIIAQPDFPKPVKITDSKTPKTSRRWIAGEVVKYLKSLSPN